MARDVRGRPDIAAVLAALGARGVTRLLVEGGGAVHATFLDRGLADRLEVFTASRSAGRGRPSRHRIACRLYPGRGARLRRIARRRIRTGCPGKLRARVKREPCSLDIVTRYRQSAAHEKCGATPISSSSPITTSRQWISVPRSPAPGVCMTVVEKAASRTAGSRSPASGETLSKTTIGQWKVGSAVNLERPPACGRRVRRPYRYRPCRWHRKCCLRHARGQIQAHDIQGARRAGAVHRVKGFGRARWRIVDGQ